MFVEEQVQVGNAWVCFRVTDISLTGSIYTLTFPHLI